MSPADPAPDADRFARVARLFRAAAALDPAARDAWLATECQGDSTLLAEVRAALEVAGQTHPLLEEPLDAPGLDDRPEPGLPDRIGAFRILGVLGRGGFGTVYRAEQDQPRRTLALKVLQPGCVQSDLLQRFAREAEVLGALRHPGIAALYDAGNVPTGFGDLPFLAMELVEGAPLHTYADARQLDGRARCALVAQVCRAIHHAHEHGVIHRDLKPGNVLVTEVDGAPLAKVLDFGIARAADARDDNLTLTGQLFGTLPYMSPEQLEGRTNDIDARADVYALGVLLFELLTGRLPLPVRDRPVSEVVRIVAEQEPPRLRTLAPGLGRDLETIVQRALQKDPQTRYPSAQALANDLESFLAQRPITARPPSRLDRAWKFVRRNRALVGTTSLAFLALIVGLVVTSLLAVENRDLAIARNETRLDLRATLYATQMIDAMELADDPGTVHVLDELLRSWEARDPADPELRDWEYRFLRRLVDEPRWSTQPADQRIRALGWLDDDLVMALAPDGTRYLDPRDGSLRDDQPFHGILGAASFARVPRLIAWAGGDKLKVGDPRDLSNLQRRRVKGKPTEVWLSPDGRFVGANGIERGLQALDRSTGELVVYAVEDVPLRATMSFDGREDGLVAVAERDKGNLHLLRAATGESVRTLLGDELSAVLLAFSPDGEILAAGLTNGAVDVWAHRPEAPLRYRFPPTDTSVTSLAWSPDSHEIAVGHEDGSIRICTLNDWGTRKLHGPQAELPRLLWSPDGGRLLAGTDAGGVHCWSTGLEDTATLHRILPVGIRTPQASWSDDGAQLWVGDRDVGWWKCDPNDLSFEIAAEGEQRRELGEPPFRVRHDGTTVTISPADGGTALLTRETEGTVDWAWNAGVDRLALRHDGILEVLGVGAALELLATHEVSGPSLLRWSDDGRLLAVATNHPEEAGIAIYDGADGASLGTTAAPGGITELRFDPEGLRIAAFSPDTDSVRVVSWRSGTLESEFDFQELHTLSLAWHPDGHRLATSGDGMLRLWDPTTGRCVFRLRDLDGALAWSPGGNMLVGVRPRGQLWRLRAD